MATAQNKYQVSQEYAKYINREPERGRGRIPAPTATTVSLNAAPRAPSRASPTLVRQGAGIKTVLPRLNAMCLKSLKFTIKV